jgi:pyruvate,orthophosphate dikinase
MDAEVCRERVIGMQESNSMLGFRGCRVGIIYPEIVQMQTKAVIGAAVQAIRQNIPVKPELMIPLVCTDHEIDLITPIISSAVNFVLEKARSDTSELSSQQIKNLEALRLTMGSMIEVPRACIRADRIAAAKHMEFVSFGSNDLSQLVFGFSRDDSHRFMGAYLEQHLVARDPFESLDIVGVGGMIQMAVRRARRVNPNIKVGVCGEHGGDPKSIKFFNHIGLNYVSCSPFRIPVAKVAAAQAHIEETARQAKEEERRMHEDFDVLPMALLW